MYASLRRMLSSLPVRINKDWIDEGTSIEQGLRYGTSAQSGGILFPSLNTVGMRRVVRSLLTVVDSS